MNFIKYSVISLFLHFLFTHNSTAQPSVPRESTWVTNGHIQAVAYANSTTYLGGDFTYVGPNTWYGAALDTLTGLPHLLFARVNGPVFVATPDGRGGWYIGGKFTRVGSYTRNGIARIRADGTVDPQWDPNAQGSIGDDPVYNPVYAIVPHGSIVYVGGNFSEIGGQPRRGVAALDTITGLATAWSPDASSTVRALAIGASVAYVGGDFSSSYDITIGGQRRNYIAAINLVTGEATPWNPDLDGRVNTIVVHSSSVFAGGEFRYADSGTVVRNYLAAFDTSTGLTTSWNPNANGSVTVFALSDTIIYVGGEFTTLRGLVRSRLAAISTSSSTPLNWNPNANGVVRTIHVGSTTIYVGGDFTIVGGGRKVHVAALDRLSGVTTSWTSYSLDIVRAVALNGDLVYVGGDFRSIGGQERNRLAAIDAVTGFATAWNPDVNGRVWEITPSGLTIYIGGEFTLVGGEARNHLAAVDVVTGRPSPWNPDPDGDVFAIALSGSKVYVGGSFYNISGIQRSRIACVYSATGNASPWNPSIGGNWVTSILVNGTTIYVAGDFGSVGDSSRQSLTAIDGRTGAALSWNPMLNSYSAVRTIALDGSNLYIGGYFNSVGGDTRNNLAAVNAITAEVTGWNPVADDGVWSLSLSGENVYVGGYFTNIGGYTRQYLASVDKITGIPTEWNPNMDGEYPDYGSVHFLTTKGSAVFAGGTFRQAGGEIQDFFAQFGNFTRPTRTPLVVNPTTGGDIGDVIVTIEGEGFRPGAQVKLSAPGREDIVADTSWTEVVDSMKIEALFQLKGKPRGMWNVVVTNLDMSEYVLENGFTIESGYEAIQLDVIGRDVILLGRQAKYYAIAYNSGNVDQFIPQFKFEIAPQFRLVEVKDGLGIKVWPDSAIGLGAPDTNSQGPILITLPYLRQGDDEVLEFTVRAVNTPLITGLKKNQVVPWIVVGKVAAGIVEVEALRYLSYFHEIKFTEFGGQVDNWNKFGDVLEEAWKQYLREWKQHPIKRAGLTLFGAVRKTMIELVKLINTADALAFANDLQQTNAVGSAFMSGNPEYIVANTANQLLRLGRVFVDKLKNVDIQFSWDPNEKIGPHGSGPPNYFVARSESLRYTVLFENMPNATAAAETIRVIDVLDEDLDWTTLTLGPVSHPAFMSVSLDSATRTITWQFNNIQLPPNRLPPEGEGWIKYSVLPKQNSPSGTQIKNFSDIIFDVNPAICTDTVVNTIDAEPPYSRILELPDTSDVGEFMVHWTGSDDALGSGIASYDIFMQDDSGRCVPWLIGTTDDSARFVGVSGKVYSFYSVARDNAGLQEPVPEIPDTRSFIRGIAPPLYLSPLRNVTINDTTPTFRWTPTAGVQGRYHLQYSSDSSFTTDTTEIDNLTDTSYTVPINQALRARKYFWRLQSIAQSGERSGFRSASEFFIDTQPPQTPLLISPMNGVTLNDTTPTFIWSSVSDAIEYYLQYSTDSTFSFVSGFARLPHTSFQVPPTIALSDNSSYFWRVASIDEAGNRSNYQAKPFRIVITDINNPRELPQEFKLAQNYPNPFNPNTTIKYQLPGRTGVVIKIYNVLGQEVKTLVDEVQEAGYKSVVWNSTNNYGNTISSGVYFYRLQAGSFIQTKKLVLLR